MSVNILEQIAEKTKLRVKEDKERLDFEKLKSMVKKSD